MEKMEVITPVKEATDWVSSLVVSKKPNGKLRVCLDPSDLNKATRKPHHRSIATEEVTHQLAGSVAGLRTENICCWLFVCETGQSLETHRLLH